MRKTTGPGTVYQSRNLTRHYASTIGTVVMLVVGAAIVAVLAYPSLLDWVLS